MGRLDLLVNSQDKISWKCRIVRLTVQGSSGYPRKNGRQKEETVRFGTQGGSTSGAQKHTSCRQALVEAFWHLEHAGSPLDMGSEVIQLISDNLLSQQES